MVNRKGLGDLLLAFPLHREGVSGGRGSSAHLGIGQIPRLPQDSHTDVSRRARDPVQVRVTNRLPFLVHGPNSRPGILKGPNVSGTVPLQAHGTLEHPILSTPLLLARGRGHPSARTGFFQPFQLLVSLRHSADFFGERRA